MDDIQSPQLKKRQARIVGIASIIWGASIFLSRIMGLLREQIIGRTLGASREADLYFASFTLPDFLNYLLAAGALSIVFIPIFVEYLERDDREGGWRALSVIANFILVAGGVGIALLAIFARPLAGLAAPGFTGPGEVDTLVRLIRIILPAQLFLVIGGLLSAALQAQDRHILPAMAPLVYSVGIVVGGLVGAHYPEWEPMDLRGASLADPHWGRLRCRSTDASSRRCAGIRSVVPANQDLQRYLWLSFPIMVGFSIVVVGRVDSQEPGLVLAGRCPVASAIRSHPHEGTDRRVRHGQRSGRLSNLSRIGGSRPSRWMHTATRVCGTVDAVRYVCGTGVHDFGRQRSVVSGLGFYVAPV